MNLLRQIFQRRPKTPASGVDPATQEAAANWLARRDAGLTTLEEKSLQEWQDANPHHRAALDRLDLTWRVLDRPLKTGAAAAVLHNLGNRARRRRQRRAFAAAAVLFVAGASVGSYALVFRSHQLPPQSVTIAAIKLPGFKVLPDGTIAELRDGAEIAVRFSEAQRRVVLVSGETYFQVTKNPARPFIVVAGEVEVRAVGTAFSVQRGQSEVKVLVTEGNVVVDVAAKSPTSTNSAGLQQVLVRAGGGAIVQVSRQGEEAQIRPLANVDLRSNLAWRSPKLEFNGTPLAEVVALLNRHSRVQFVIDDPELARRKISGTFGEENTDAFLWFLETSFNIQPEGTGENVVALRSKR